MSKAVRGLQSLLLLLGASAAAPALAATNSDQLCGEAVGAELYPSEQGLIAAAETVEAQLQAFRLAAGDSGAAAVGEALDLDASSPARPSPAALARYCSAAGEIMRLSPGGSQRQAQIYLQTALQQSRTANLPAVTALTAYRLGVVSISGASVTGLRGGEPKRRNGRLVAGRLRAAETAESATGQICSALADFDKDNAADASFSMLALDCAARLALEAGDPAVSALASLRFGRFALGWVDSSDDPDELLRVARDKSLAAIAVAERIADPGLRTELIGRLARTALELGATPDQGLRRVPGLIRSGGGGDPAALALAAETEARLALADGKGAVAAPLVEQAILVESARPLPVRLPGLFLLLADAQPQRRQEHVASAYAALENIRPRLPRLDPLTEESMFSLHMRRVFESAADAQLAAADADDRAGHVRTAQQIVEAFREAELQSAVGSECLPMRSPVDPGDLAAGEILLYPLLFDDRVELIYVVGAGQGGAAQFRRLPPNRSTNRREVARLVDSLSVELTRGSADQWKVPARRLYEILIAPIESHLSDSSTLAIIPDGPLRGTPFAALLSADGRHLVERTAMTVAPALAYSQPGDARTGDKLSIVAASLARKVSVPAGTFAALTSTQSEAKIAASNGAPGTLVEDFTRKQLVEALSAGNVDVLHLATHAAFNGRSDRAFIVANGEVIRMSELRDILAQNRVRGELLDLLVLSACETAVGDDEASMGLAGAAVQAGALSAIASLWQVDDAGTAELMRHFYGNYRSGQSRAQALRQAQLELIRNGGDNSDPFVWSAFTLLGAWR